MGRGGSDGRHQVQSEATGLTHRIQSSLLGFRLEEQKWH